ncbi:caveolin-3-like [Cryptotermes secundus]|uniref:caveolin-3-like n=1 Tax=Cryptotermes secundus TaxID=105785 RepID=UPI000CD7C466|nr:caveolin-3-like [Cryptotermes secundus]XP_023703365.1 caveolin-3-like [Cryptotermes secundus]
MYKGLGGSCGETRKSMGGNTMDEEDRDPNNLNQHLQVQWDDVIGEPEGIRSVACGWRLSGWCFRSSRNCCYVFLSVLLAPVTGLCLGCTFACLAFQHIWCVAPCLRVCKISCAATRNFLQACTHATVIPFTEALSYFWSRISVKMQKLPEATTERKEDILLI